jgi:anti-sigma-K factor RskA
MTRRLSNDAAHAIAAEYVLGTLRGRARRRFESLRAADPALDSIAQRWEEELTVLTERVPAVEPPARVWRAIAQRVSGGAAAGRTLGMWPAIAALTGGLSAVLLGAFLWLSPAPASEPIFVAVLTAPDSVPRMVVSMHAPDVLKLHLVKPWERMEGKSLEVWVLPKEGAPRSLGLVANVAGETLVRISPDDPRVRGVNALAVSLEPAGGSPTKQPTGPVLCAGPIAPVRKI